MTTSSTIRFRPHWSPRAPMMAGLLVGGAAVASAGSADGAVLCPFRRCTGGYCPGCGLTRGANRLAHGDLSASWAHHPWIVLAVGQVLLVTMVLVFIDHPRRADTARRAALPLAIANCAVLLAIWAVRLSNGTIPTGWF